MDKLEAELAKFIKVFCLKPVGGADCRPCVQGIVGDGCELLVSKGIRSCEISSITLLKKSFVPLTGCWG